MAISIDRGQAEKVLLAAFRMRCTKNDDLCERIEAILNGTHKTYRYILVNGLLAKATSAAVDPLALQAGSEVKGAFDARSLCHKVVVPFEKDFLHNALGGSNEPFLNKPARFTELSPKNAVRREKDKEALLSLIHIFTTIQSSAAAKAYLACALHYLHDRIEKLRIINEKTSAYNPDLIEIYEFITKFCEQSNEGENLVLTVAALEKIYHFGLQEPYSVLTHKINQSGVSSQEIGDIDVFRNGVFSYAIEVKDKDFTSYDVQHAFDKMIKNSAKKGQFIFGQNVKYNAKKIEATLKKYEQKGFFILFQDILSYAKIMLFKTDSIEKQKFVGALQDTANEINAKPATKKRMQMLLQEILSE